MKLLNLNYLFMLLKLLLTCIIVDILFIIYYLLFDDITENIETLEEWFESINITIINNI